MKTLRQIKKAAWNAYEEGIDRNSILRRLTREGYMVLGRGGFATVVAHPEDDKYVIRVGSYHNRSFYMGHMKDGFPNYAQAVMCGWIKSRYALKVYDLHDCGDYSVTVSERCQKMASRKFKLKVSSTIFEIKNYGCDPQSYSFQRGAVRAFLENVSSYGNLDSSPSNIMQRISGTPVFTDPLTQ